MRVNAGRRTTVSSLGCARETPPRSRRSTAATPPGFLVFCCECFKTAPTRKTCYRRFSCKHTTSSRASKAARPSGRGSTSGDIHYSGRILGGGQYEFKSHSGDVIITIGDDVGFELEANTFSGEIESDFEMRVSSGGRHGRSISAVIGNGSAMIEVTTFSGNIMLRKR